MEEKLRQKLMDLQAARERLLAELNSVIGAENVVQELLQELQVEKEDEENGEA